MELYSYNTNVAYVNTEFVLKYVLIPLKKSVGEFTSLMIFLKILF